MPSFPRTGADLDSRKPAKEQEMAEPKVIQKSEEKTEAVRNWPGLNLLEWRNPFHPMARFADALGVNAFCLVREFAKEVNKVFPGFPTIEFTPEGWMPPGEIEKVNGNLSVTADLRGIKKENLKIEISDQAPTVQGERRYEKKEEKEGVYRLQADLEHHRFLQRSGSGWRSSA